MGKGEVDTFSMAGGAPTGGQKSEIKTATLTEPAVKVSISIAHELYQRI